MTIEEHVYYALHSIPGHKAPDYLNRVTGVPLELIKGKVNDYINSEIQSKQFLTWLKLELIWKNSK